MDPDAPFAKALVAFKAGLTPEQRNAFQIDNKQDVHDAIVEIQSRHGSSKKLRGMSRMSRFLEAMQQLEQVVSVFLNVSAAVAFIWGPIKLFLVVSVSKSSLAASVSGSHLEGPA